VRSIFSFLLRRLRGSDVSNHEGVEHVSTPSFHELGVSEPVLRTLTDRSFHAPFRIQTLVLPDALGGLDIVAESPTGSGKTLAFAVTIVERTDAGDPRPSALVLVPTRELALQVTEELASIAPARGLRIASVYGGVPIPAQAKRAQSAHVLVATPGRLQDLLERRLVSLDRVRILVLDEADRMLDMGFQPQVDRIVRRLQGNRQTMLFSATLTGRVEDLVAAYTSNPVRVEGDHTIETGPSEVEHRFVAVTAETKLETLIEELRKADGLTLVFVRTKRGADRLGRRLGNEGVKAGVLHGGMTQSARERSLARFDAGAVTTLVATDLAARGLDLDRITHVINFDPPADHDGYVHRVGRTGRAGRSGTGVTLVLPEQQADLSRVATRLGREEQFASQGMRVAPPRLVYTSRRSNRWGSPAARRRG
jgi:superfamily II DNA/RNA helicase